MSTMEKKDGDDDKNPDAHTIDGDGMQKKRKKKKKPTCNVMAPETIAGGTNFEKENKMKKKKKRKKKKKPTCNVIAPETMVGGTEFETKNIDGITFIATVPDGGVIKGSAFTVPYPSSSSFSKSKSKSKTETETETETNGSYSNIENLAVMPSTITSTDIQIPSVTEELEQTQEQYIPCYINADQQAYPGDEGQIAIADMEMNSDTSTDNYSIVDHRNPDDIPTEKFSCATCTCFFCIAVALGVSTRIMIMSLICEDFLCVAAE